MRPHRALGAVLLVPALLVAGIGPDGVVEHEADSVTAAPSDQSSGDADVPAAVPVAAEAPSTAGLEPTARTTTTTTTRTTAKGKTKPAPLEPVAEPTPIAPAPTEPVATEPVATQPVTTEPVTTEPVATEPVTTEPVTTQPVTSEPVATEPVPTTHTDPTSSSGTGSTTTVRRTVPVGVTVPWGPLDRTRLAATTTTMGTAPVLLQWYTGFGEAVDVAKLQAVVDAGATPVVTWEPWKYTDGVHQPAYALSTFTAGKHDAYLTAWADALARWKGPVMIRFAHEMNGSWYPWAAGVNGNTAADYVAAWRHVHGVFAARGATNVRWVWSPNVVYTGSTPLASLYPGDAYVDVIGVDGYNWGTSVSWETWKSPEQVFGRTFAELRTLAPARPLLIAETASTELGGDKAAWITELFAWAAPQSDVRGIIWFDENKETDWRIASSTAATEAFRAAVTPQA